jgi:putrescine transport system substrate-binding protein
MCIPADAPHKENAHQFIEFLLQPEVIADCTATTNYANANLASKKLIDPEILANPAVYPDAATMARLWAPKPLSDKLTREMSRAFSKLKSK